MLKKGFKFILNKKDDIIAFYLNFILLIAKVDSFLKKQSYKNNIFRNYSTNCIKIIFVLIIDVVALYVQAYII